jgi:hypothetical protein
MSDSHRQTAKFQIRDCILGDFEQLVRYASDSIKPFFKRKKAKKGTVHELSPPLLHCLSWIKCFDHRNTALPRFHLTIHFT